MIPTFDLVQTIDQIAASKVVQLRDPFGSQYADPEKQTRSQKQAHAFLMHRWNGVERPHPRRKGQTIMMPPIITMIGAKGSGKTHLGSQIAALLGQKFPESLGCIISNTYSQALDNAAPLLIKMVRSLGFKIEFFKEKKIKGELYHSLFVIDLDGRGYEEGINSYVLLRSFEAVNKLEGIELDWLWCEEVQDTDWDSFRVVYTRVRGKGANRVVYVAAMPFDETHWMYNRLPLLGAIPENELREEIGVEALDAKSYAEVGLPIPEEIFPIWEANSIGVMFEPSIYENEKNLPDGEIERLAASLDYETFQRWIYGNRTSMTTDKVAYAYNDALHRKGRASKILSHYDPSAQLVLAIDFNVRPMCASVWQLKPWNDEWLDNKYDVEVSDQGDVTFLSENIRDDGTVDLLPTNPAAPNREVAVQVDEFEIWRGSTKGMMEAFLERYGTHNGQIVILGDATGNRDDTRSQTTDWEIIIRAVEHLPNAMVIQGLVVNSDLKTGKVAFTNPPRRDTFNVLNGALKDGQGRSHMFFLPKSNLTSGSGGVAASVMSARVRPDGHFDDSNDKKPDEMLPRSHFFDTVRYFAWWLRGGLVSREDFERNVRNLQTEIRTEAPRLHSEGLGQAPTFAPWG